MVAGKTTIDIPFEWDGELTLQKTEMVKDRQGQKTKQRLVFSPTRATITLEYKNNYGWSWKFKEDVTPPEVTKSEHTGNFWNEPYEYPSQPWYMENGFKDPDSREVTVDVSLRVEQKASGNGWHHNVNYMVLVADEIVEKESVQEQGRVLESNETISTIDNDEDHADSSLDDSSIEDSILEIPNSHEWVCPDGTKNCFKCGDDHRQIAITKGMAFNNLTNILVALIGNDSKILYGEDLQNNLVNDWLHFYETTRNGNVIQGLNTWHPTNFQKRKDYCTPEKHVCELTIEKEETE